MQIESAHIAKRYGNTVVLRDFSLRIQSGEKWHIAGSNGKGKSTLMQMLAAFITPDKGRIDFHLLNGQTLDASRVYSHISITTPYTDLITDFTLSEQMEFHFRFKKLLFTKEEFDAWISRSKLDIALNRPLGQLSSGMKQKAKLLLCLSVESECIFLDEPCSNLDADGKAFYRELVERRMQFPATWIVCSNNLPEEHFFCTHTLDLDRILT